MDPRVCHDWRMGCEWCGDLQLNSYRCIISVNTSYLLRRLGPYNIITDPCFFPFDYIWPMGEARGQHKSKGKKRESAINSVDREDEVSKTFLCCVSDSSNAFRSYYAGDILKRKQTSLGFKDYHSYLLQD